MLYRAEVGFTEIGDIAIAVVEANGAALGVVATAEVHANLLVGIALPSFVLAGLQPNAVGVLLTAQLADAFVTLIPAIAFFALVDMAVATGATQVGRTGELSLCTGFARTGAYGAKATREHAKGR